jgi:hypothetical protein
MNEMSLSRLYRRMTSRTVRNVNADELVDALAPDSGLTAERREALAADVAASAAQADLARMLRALQPESEALAADVERVNRTNVHPLRAREVRVANGARRHARPLRWVGSIAACCALAFGVFALNGGKDSDWNNVSASATSAVQQDRIFTSNDVIFASADRSAPRTRAARGGDELFRGDFSSGG